MVFSYSKYLFLTVFFINHRAKTTTCPAKNIHLTCMTHTNLKWASQHGELCICVSGVSAHKYYLLKTDYIDSLLAQTLSLHTAAHNVTASQHLLLACLSCLTCIPLTLLHAVNWTTCQTTPQCNFLQMQPIYQIVGLHCSWLSEDDSFPKHMSSPLF